MYNKKLTMIEFPVPLEIFLTKYHIKPDEYSLAKLLEGIMELGNKLAYDINNSVNVTDVIEVIQHSGININISENILSEFVNTIYACIYDMLAKMALYDLLGSVKYVIAVNSYQLAVETYKI